MLNRITVRVVLALVAACSAPSNEPAPAVSLALRDASASESVDPEPQTEDAVARILEWRGPKGRSDCGFFHVATATFEGSWRTTYGTLRIALDGERATGRYSYGDGAMIEGSVDGHTLRFAYTEPNGVTGRGRFELAADGASFRGVWKAGARDDAELDAPGVGEWIGRRVIPVADRVWLVVLEAYWQDGLHDPDYSYGEMLGAFFERLPNVAFRQRFFGGQEDFVRLARECEALEEPVIVYVSSHGTPEGIACPGGILSGATIGAALANVPNVKLLHLGACAGLAGDLPRQIRAAAGADFPISGFMRPVDWGGSALVDFTYLDLVLERELEPAEAVTETRRLVTFAGEKAPEHAAIPATDLAISVAP